MQNNCSLKRNLHCVILSAHYLSPGFNFFDKSFWFFYHPPGLEVRKKELFEKLGA